MITDQKVTDLQKKIFSIFEKNKLGLDDCLDVLGPMVVDLIETAERPGGTTRQHRIEKLEQFIRLLRGCFDDTNPDKVTN